MRRLGRLFDMVGQVSVAASRPAEPVVPISIEDVRRVRVDHHGHSADRVDSLHRLCDRRFRGSRGLDQVDADGADDLGHDRQRDLLSGSGTDVEADRRPHPSPLRVRETHLVEHRSTSHPARDQADKGHTGVKGRPDRLGLTAPVAADNHRSGAVHALPW